MSPDRNWLGQRLAELHIALLFLTRLPGLSAIRLKEPVPGIAASAWAFPLVGIVIGALGAGAYVGSLSLGLPPVLATLIALATTLFTTGAIHEDGLADFADGLGGGQDRAQKLAIMRDSHIGTYGVLALIIALALKATAIVSLAAVSGGTATIVPLAMIAIATCSRAAMVIALYWLPPARTDGLGQSATNIGLPRTLVAALLGLAGLVLLTSVWPIMLLAILAATAVVGGLAYRHIRGQTGDVLGATQQAAEIAAWVSLLIWLG